jgi:ribosome modulation factor
VKKLLEFLFPSHKRTTWPAPKTPAVRPGADGKTLPPAARQDTYDAWINSLHADNCRDGANLQHLKHVFEGYKSFVVGVDRKDCPYSPGGIRMTSWLIGFDRADHDLFYIDSDSTIPWD